MLAVLNSKSRQQNGIWIFGEICISKQYFVQKERDFIFLTKKGAKAPFFMLSLVWFLVSFLER